MALSASTTAWVVSGAIGVATFTAGVLAGQGDSAQAGEPRPAVTVSGVAVPPGAGPSTGPTVKPTASPTAGDDDPAKTAPSPVSPPSAEDPDED